MDNRLQTDLDPLNLDQSDSSRFGLAIRDFLIQYSRILVSSALSLSWVTLQMSSPEPSRTWDTVHESDGENVINLFPEICIHPSQAFMLTLLQTCP